MTRRRVLLIRDAAIGDGLMITPALHDLHDKGYEVHVACKKIVGEAVYACNPYVHCLHRLERCETMLERDQKIDAIKAKIDPYLCFDMAGTCEGQFLYHSSCPEYFMGVELRRALAADANYYEHINCRVLGCERTKPELHVSAIESRFWTHLRASTLGNKYVQVQLMGSSFNKNYPWWPIVVKGLQELHPRLVVLLTGPPEATLLELACTEHGCDESRLWATCGDERFTLRDALVSTKFVDLFIGPETGVTNAAGCFDTPKIVLLSHSNHRNLCDTWQNVYSIQAPVACSPCYRIVGIGDPCDYITEHEDERIAGALRCMAAIDPQSIIDKAREALKC
jgi:ADP-heptose:LPS heptosyltransferase